MVGASLEETLGAERAEAPGSPIASRTRGRQEVLQAPLREAVGPNGRTTLIKVPLSSYDLETWKGVAKGYRNDSIGVARHFQFLIDQHNPDWKGIHLLLDQVTETEKQLILKIAQEIAADSPQLSAFILCPLYGHSPK